MDKSAKLSEINLDNLILNENAYFYRKARDIKDSDISHLFRAARNDKKAKKRYKSIIRNSFVNSDHVEIATYSLDIFEFESKPTFLKNSDGYLIEKKYGLFLIIEFEEYIAIIRRNVSGINSLKSITEPVDYDVLSRFLVTSKSKFEKIESSSMNTSDTSSQRKISEAKDLKGIYSRFGASKEILNSIRLEDSDNKHTIALKTSRVNSFNLKSDFRDIVYWIIITLDLIKKAYENLPESTFLDSFAKPVKFADVIHTIKPTYILIRFNQLLDEIESGNISKSYIFDDEGTEKNIDLKTVIKDYNEVNEIYVNEDDQYQTEDFLINIYSNSIAINSKDLKKIFLEFENGYATTLNKYLNSGNHFIINFDKIDYVYTNRKIFKDSKLLENLDHFFETFIAKSELVNVTSEKGSYTPTSTTFDTNSIFGHIENIEAKNSKILICDDMGTEWGDFISISENEITFYHAKYNDEGLSASNLEEVFGQAQKNLGFLELTSDLVDERKDKWSRTFVHKKIKTNIDRIRKCPVSSNKIEHIKDYVNFVTSNPHTQKKVYIVVNFISKEKLIKSINQLKRGLKFKNDAVIVQILWYINSLLSVALERNVDLRIICQP